MEALTGLFTDPYRMGALIVLLLLVWILRGGELITPPRKKK
jgi:hypothetical protein